MAAESTSNQPLLDSHSDKPNPIMEAAPKSQPPVAAEDLSMDLEKDPDFRLVKFFFHVLLFLLVAGAGYFAAEYVPGAKQFVLDRIQSSFPNLNLPRDVQNSDNREVASGGGILPQLRSDCCS